MNDNAKPRPRSEINRSRILKLQNVSSRQLQQQCNEKQARIPNIEDLLATRKRNSIEEALGENEITGQINYKSLFSILKHLKLIQSSDEKLLQICWEFLAKQSRKSIPVNDLREFLVSLIINKDSSMLPEPVKVLQKQQNFKCSHSKNLSALVTDASYDSKKINIRKQCKARENKTIYCKRKVLVNIDVIVEPGKTKRICLRYGDCPRMLAKKFCRDNNLDKEAFNVLQNMLVQQLKLKQN